MLVIAALEVEVPGQGRGMGWAPTEVEAGVGCRASWADFFAGVGLVTPGALWLIEGVSPSIWVPLPPLSHGAHSQVGLSFEP